MKAARREIHLALKQANYDYERIQYNTVVSAGMKMLNALEARARRRRRRAALVREGLSILIRVLYPVVPHIGCVLWDDLGFAGELGPLLDAPWPQVDPDALAQDEIELVLQINGKLRGKITVPAAADRAAIEAAARAQRRGREACRRRAGEEGHRRARAARQCRRLSVSAASRLAGILVGLALAVGLAGCGFHLRGDVDYPFTTLYVNAPAAPPIAAELKRYAGKRRNARSRKPPPAAQVTLDISGVADDKQVLSLSGGGRVREYQLIKRVTFAVHDAKATTGCPPARSSSAARTRSTNPKCSRARRRRRGC